MGNGLTSGIKREQIGFMRALMYLNTIQPRVFTDERARAGGLHDQDRLAHGAA
jgi:hypothetical protein